MSSISSSSDPMYTVNFLWVNLNPQNRQEDRAEHIFGGGEHSEDFTEKLSAWAEDHPGVQLNLWYDSALVTAKAMQNTAKKLSDISSSTGASLSLRDVRHLPNLEGDIELSLHPATPVYFRVDLLKALIADHLMHENLYQRYCVISDIDVTPFSRANLLHTFSSRYFSSHGYIYGHNPQSVGFENQLLIFDRKHPSVKDVHREHIIDSIKKTSKRLRSHIRGTSFKANLQPFDSQSIFRRYSVFCTALSMQACCGVHAPSIPIEAPESAFNHTRRFPATDHRLEAFYFEDDCNIPYTRYGRASSDKFSQIAALKEWKAEPL